MDYSIIGILAIIIHVIVNINILRTNAKDMSKSDKAYRSFLIAVIVYHYADLLWGLLMETHFVTALYVITEFYFAIMAVSVYLWAVFTVYYLASNEVLDRRIKNASRLLLYLQIIFLIANIFKPIMFYYDAAGGYHPLTVRYIFFGIQILMFTFSMIFTFVVARRTSGPAKRRNHTIATFSLIMILGVTAQMYLPGWPAYSVTYLIGCCLLYTFVVEDKKDEYLRALEEALGREASQREELGFTRHMAYTDSLTGVKTKNAYILAEEKINKRIGNGEVEKLGIAIFDLNDLKNINDTHGHNAGDQAIVNACHLVCEVFKHSPIYRVGGDEFVVILEGEDYDRRLSLIQEFNKRIETNIKNEGVVVSAGLAIYVKDEDKDLNSIFKKADANMYEHKKYLKGSASFHKGTY